MNFPAMKKIVKRQKSTPNGFISKNGKEPSKEIFSNKLGRMKQYNSCGTLGFYFYFFLYLNTRN
jgi:hypothetical protein